jgi:transposase
MLAHIMGIGVETADMMVHEVLSRNLRDQRAVARYAGLTGAPYESGAQQREKGLARAGNARVRGGMANWPGAGSSTRKIASSRSGISREQRERSPVSAKPLSSP